MLKVQDIHELIKLIDQSSIDEFTYENEGTSVTIKKSAIQEMVMPRSEQPLQKSQAVALEKTEPAAEIPVAANEEQTPVSTVAYDKEIVSPMVGTFYSASNPETPDFVQVGSNVDESSVVCIVEAMKLFNEIEAEVSGEIVEILVNNGELVEYGQPLFRVKTK
ncbi:acetyl-CoA carboxylase biotin carboxyl carrier protein [Virgibacillus halophilus]|uniref:acetyl-CoA carboxylase biotin carboxyl carrier protein n=1 Tax=Tigheibacillus halophilus TaxID=361280 RepID=UPI00363E417A